MQHHQPAQPAGFFYARSGSIISVGIDQKGTILAVSLPNGTKFAIATAYDVKINVTAISNANPAVCTAAAHGLANGDLIEITSGWSKLNNRIMRVAASASGTFALEGADTTSVTVYPVGGGVGSVREITAQTQITQVLETTSSGGEMGFTEYGFLEDDFSSQLPTQASAQSLALSIADDPSLAGYQAAKAAADSREPRALIATLPKGAKILYNGIMSLNETPSFTKNQVMAVSGTFSLNSPPVRYAA